MKFYNYIFYFLVTLIFSSNVNAEGPWYKIPTNLMKQYSYELKIGASASLATIFITWLVKTKKANEIFRKIRPKKEKT